MTATTSPTRQFPCPSCSANLEFDPSSNRLVCPYCGTTKEVEQNWVKQVTEQTYDDYLNEEHTQIAALSQTAMEATCPGCHASVTFEPPDVAGQCPFCGTSIVAQSHTANPVITPGGVLPFQFGRKDAQKKIRHWLGKLWFAPSGLKKMAQHAGIQGVYLPFWTYDSNTINRYKGKRGEYYYVNVSYTTTDSDGKRVRKTRQERRTRWYPASGTVSRFFDDVLIPATTAVDTARLNQLEPWNLSQLVPYDPSYLAGLKAQRYQVNLKQGFECAKSKMEPDIDSAVRRDIGGDTQQVHSIQTSYTDITFKHILLPVWIASYRFKNKPYQVMINAQTGEILGDRPWSVVKLVGASVAAAIVTFTLLFGGRIINTLEDWFEPSPQRPSPTQTIPQSSSPQPLAPQSSPSAVPMNPAPGNQAPGNPTPQTDMAFQQAINIAGQASAQTQTAQTPQDWQRIANLWIQSIESLKQVPPSSPNYNTAQQKIQEYQINLNYARQQIN